MTVADYIDVVKKAPRGKEDARLDIKWDLESGHIELYP